MDLLKLYQRAVVLAGSAVTYIQALAAGLLLASGQIAEAAPEGHETVTQWLVVAVTVLTEIVTVVRSRTPVPGMARGLLLRKGTELTVRADDTVTGQGDMLHKAA